MCIYVCVWYVCVWYVCDVLWYIHTHTYGCVCAFEWSETWVLVFSPLSFWGLLLVAAYAWLTGPQASGDCPVSDSHSSRNTETAQSTFCFTQVLGVWMKILRLSKHFTHWAVSPPPPPPSKPAISWWSKHEEERIKYSIGGKWKWKKRSWIGRRENENVPRAMF